jgi:hypothetical protein
MLPLGTLLDEPPEPMKREDFERVQKAITGWEAAGRDRQAD